MSGLPPRLADRLCVRKMTPSSVLVVKPSSLGDIVHTLPAVHYLESDFPGGRIILDREHRMGSPPGGECRPQNCHPFSQRRVPGSVGIFKFVRWCRELSQFGTRPGSGFSRIISKRMDLTQREGEVGLRFVGFKRSIPLSVMTDVLPFDAGQHSVDRYLALARLAGADTSGPIQFPLPRGRPISSLELPERFVVLHPFARGARKSLTPERDLSSSPVLLVPIPVIIVGRSRDAFRMDRNGISLVNQTDLSELIWLLRRSSFIVSVDSGPMHIGAAITPELLSIHTWSDPGSVGPYNPDAWIWKAQCIFQVRSNPIQVNPGSNRRASKPRPDRELCPRPAVAIIVSSRYWIRYAFVRYRLRSGQARD